MDNGDICYLGASYNALDDFHFVYELAFRLCTYLLTKIIQNREWLLAMDTTTEALETSIRYIGFCSLSTPHLTEETPYNRT